MNTFLCLNLSLLAVLLLVGVPKGESVNYRVFRGHYYNFSEKELSWDEAKKNCANNRMTLVTIPTIEEAKFLIEKIGICFKGNTEKFWTSLRGVQIKRLEKYRDIDKAAGEPNSEDCLYWVSNQEIGYTSCHQAYHYICKKEIE